MLLETCRSMKLTHSKTNFCTTSWLITKIHFILYSGYTNERKTDASGFHLAAGIQELNTTICQHPLFLTEVSRNVKRFQVPSSLSSRLWIVTGGLVLHMIFNFIRIIFNDVCSTTSAPQVVIRWISLPLYAESRVLLIAIIARNALGTFWHSVVMIHETTVSTTPWPVAVAYSGILFGGGGFNKFSWGQRTERTGIWGR